MPVFDKIVYFSTNSKGAELTPYCKGADPGINSDPRINSKGADPRFKSRRPPQSASQYEVLYSKGRATLGTTVTARATLGPVTARAEYPATVVTAIATLD